MMKIKTIEDIKVMSEGGRLLGNILKALLQEAKLGVKTKDLDNLAQNLIEKIGGKPSFKTVKGYKWATCMCVNNEVVHGIPNDVLSEGDVLCIDIGLFYKGFHTDTAWTKLIKNQKEESIERFLAAGKRALYKAINQVRIGNRVGHISKAIQETIEEGGYSVVKALVGHGIGKKLHEEPQIPGFLTSDIKATPQLEEGMVLAIEVIYNEGSDQVMHKNDGWTIVTKDGSNSAVFEHTVVVTKEGAQILTLPELTKRPVIE